MSDSLQSIYAKLPSIKCRGKCQEACGPIACSGREAASMEKANGGPLGEIGQDFACPLLTAAGKCRVYAARPMICRLWGLTKTMRCPHGCTPSRWLSARECSEFLKAVDDGKLSGPAAPMIRAMMPGPHFPFDSPAED